MISAYRVVSWLYPTIPLIAAIVASIATRRKQSVAPMRTYLRTCVLGTILGVATILAYAMVMGGSISVWQAAVACWWVTASLFVIQSLNLLVEGLLSRALRLGATDDRRQCCPAAGFAAAVFRATIVFLAGAAYLSAVGISYRPRLTHPGNPRTLMNVDFEQVHFSATDGVRLDAWWIPARQTMRTDRLGLRDWGRDTIILCPGFGADKASQLMLTRDLIPNGFNVLALDFRAQGKSDGHFSTFGNLERRDVLGAVHWIRTQHAQACNRVLGLGVDTGAAALIGAAADPGPDGQAIDAVALVDPFDGLDEAIHDVAEDRLLPLPGLWATRVALPVAAAQLGGRLSGFSPHRDVQLLWPRPLLVLQSTDDPFFSPHAGAAFYAAAYQPKYLFAPKNEPRQKLLFRDERVSQALRIFFAGARSMI